MSRDDLKRCFSENHVQEQVVAKCKRKTEEGVEPEKEQKKANLQESQLRRIRVCFSTCEIYRPVKERERERERGGGGVGVSE